MTDHPVLSWDQRDGVLCAAMRHPPTNAMGPPLLDALNQLADEFERGSAKVLVVGSAVPGHFAAGAEIELLSQLDVERFADHRDAARAPLERLARCRRPSIAAIDGGAFGAGLELAMACTLRYASRAARFGLPEVTLGLIPGGGGTQRLPSLVGRGRALELMLSGREIDAEEALRAGLVDRLLDGDLLGQTLEIARCMARASGPAMAAIIQCVDVARDLPHELGLAVEGVALLSAFEEGEAREGIAALLEQRPPSFA